MKTGRPFKDFSLHEHLQQSLDKIEFKNCTPIQEKAMPHILNGSDVSGLAQTGTGKTAAYMLPLIERILRSQNSGETTVESSSSETEVETTDSKSVSSEDSDPKNKDDDKEDSGEPGVPGNIGMRSFANWQEKNFALVLVPTRELAEQVKECAKEFLQDSEHRVVVIYGGVPIEQQIKELEKGFTFIVATPGRLIDHFKRHRIDLKQVRAVIFDEADRMFDMGFKDDMKYILRRIPEERQLLLFSATLNLDVFNVAYQFGSNPVELNVSLDQATAENVEDFMFHLGRDEKPGHLLGLIQKLKPKQLIIFTNFKNQVDRIAEFLTKNGHKALGISSLMNQNQRKRVMSRFRDEEGENILVATDVAARGLDIEGVDLVVNFELPEDAENYVHRIGRTGRAGEKGKAYSFVSDRDVESLERIHKYLDRKIETEWMESEDLPEGFKPFPAGEPFRARSRSGSDHRRPSGGGRSGGGRKDGGRDSSRRSDRNGSGRRPDKRRATEGRDREDRRPEDQKDGDQPRRSRSRTGKNVHRDKVSGRHRKNTGDDNQKRDVRGGDARSGEGRKKSRSNPNNKNRNRSHSRRNSSAGESRRGTPHTAQNKAQQKGLLSRMGSAIKKLFG